jgi:hypothetical protein
MNFQLFMNKTQIINQELSTAFDFELPCKPLLGPKLMQPQSSLRVVQGSIVWRQLVRVAYLRRKWEVLGWRGLSEAIFALAVQAWHRTVHRTVNYHNYGKITVLPNRNYAVIYKNTVRTVKSVPYRTPCSAQA